MNRFLVPLFGFLFATAALAQPVVGTRPANDNSTRAASTAYVDRLTADQPKGAACDGVTNAADTVAAIVTATGRLTVPNGCVVRIATTSTIAGPVAVAAGGRIKADGATVTFGAGVTGPLSRIFETAGAGAIRFASATQPAVHPEWWGGGGGAGAVDSLPALQAAAASGSRKIVLQVQDYYISTTWKVNVSGLVIQGQGLRGKIVGETTRIIVSGSTADVMQLGPDTLPAGGINAFTHDVTLRDVSLTRNVAPTLPGGAVPQDTAVGLRAQYIYDLVVERTATHENSVGYRFHGVVNTKVDDNYAFKSLASGNPGTDYFYGFYLDGTGQGFAAGGNASLFMRRNTASLGVTGGLASSIGIYAVGGFVDSFISGFETASVATGVSVSGLWGNSSVSASDYKGGNADLQLDGLIIDGFTNIGLSISNVNEFGAIRVTDGYFAPAAVAGALAGIRVDQNHGMLTLTNNQTVCWPNRGAGFNAFGLYVTNSELVHAVGNKWLGCGRPEAMVGASFSEFVNLMMNPSGYAPFQSPTYVSGSTRSIFRPSATGAASSFASAIYLDAGSTYNEVDPTKVNVASYPGKVNYNGSVTTAAAFGTGNVQLGVMPAWGEVTGKPSTFAPSAHTHDAGEIASGVLDVARLPVGHRLLFSGYGGDTNNSASGSGTAFLHTPSYTIPANTLTLGRILRVTVHYKFSAGTAPPTLTHGLRLGGTLLTQATGVSVAVSAGGWQVGYQYIVTATAAPGASATIEATTVGGANGGSSVSDASAVGMPVTKATNGSLVLAPFTTWSGVGTGTTTITLSQFIVEALN